MEYNSEKSEIQSYKYWLIEYSLEDTFSTLVDWIELRVQIMEEAKEETTGLGRKKWDKVEERKTDKRDEKRRARGYNTTSKPWKCIITSCEEAHPPWTCQTFKSMSVPM